MDEQLHGRVLALQIVNPAIYALVGDLTGKMQHKLAVRDVDGLSRAAYLLMRRPRTERNTQSHFRFFNRVVPKGESK